MKNSIEILAIKNCLIHYHLIEKLYSIGLQTDSYWPEITNLSISIFGLDGQHLSTDKAFDIFKAHAKKLNELHPEMKGPIPDNLLHDLSKKIYKDWKALKSYQQIVA